jgi:DNA anti-recombination protein RmuC
VYNGLKSLVKVLHKLPSYMQQVKERLQQACATAWSTFCSVVKNLWQRVKRIRAPSISRKEAEQKMQEYFTNFSTEQFEEMMAASQHAHDELQRLVDWAKEVRQQMAAAAAPPAAEGA